MNQGKLLERKKIVTEEQRDRFRRDGHGVIPQLLSPDEMNAANSALLATENRVRLKLNDEDRQMGACGSQFLYNLQNVDSLVWQFITSPRLGQAAAELLGVDGIRILHYNCFFKPPGGCPSPWHQDYLFIPLEAEKIITAWIPLVNLTSEMGLLTFASGSHKINSTDLAKVNQHSPEELGQELAAMGWQLTTVGNMVLRDVSFHNSIVLHGAPSNNSQQMRAVVNIGFYADGACIQDSPEFNSGVVPANSYRQHFLQEYFPDLQPGDLAQTPDHPLVYTRLD